jgi:hypothetical protein
LYFEETIARFIGWFDGELMGCMYIDNDNEESLEQDIEIINELRKGGKQVYFDASKIRNINK